MEALPLLLNHRTIRKYKPDPIPDEILTNILNAGFRASTTGNMQVYSVIVTRDEENRRQLWEYHFKQNMVLEAPLLLTFCADFHRFSQWCRLREADPAYDNFLSFYTASIDALLVAQNVAIAAESFGLGICYLGTTTYMAGPISEFLGLPDAVVPVTTLVVGFPDEDPGLTDRLPDHGLIHDEKYKPYDRNAIDEIYREKEAMPLTARLLEENKLNTLARVFTEKRYTREDNLAFSRSFLALIRKQGFMNHGD